MLLGCRAIPLPEPTRSLEKTDVGTFDITICSGGIPPVDAVFPVPVLVELMGGGFDIPWGTDYILRWPRVQKVFLDRHWMEGVSRSELRENAQKAIQMGSQGEMEGWKDALGVVDRYHAAAATTVPSSSLGDKAREEQVVRRDDGKYGVDMLYGLNIDALLRKGAELAALRSEATNSLKREIVDTTVEIQRKRTCLSAKTLTTSNVPQHLPPPLQPPQRPKPVTENVQELLSKARVLAICKSRRDEISILLPQATHLEIHELSPEKENRSPVCLNTSRDYVVLVRGNAANSVRKVLEMVKKASRMGGRWHVYNWKVVQCFGEGMDNVNWGNEHLWTYIDGEAY